MQHRTIQTVSPASDARLAWFSSVSLVLIIAGFGCADEAAPEMPILSDFREIPGKRDSASTLQDQPGLNQGRAGNSVDNSPSREWDDEDTGWTFPSEPTDSSAPPGNAADDMESPTDGAPTTSDGEPSTASGTSPSEASSEVAAEAVNGEQDDESEGGFVCCGTSGAVCDLSVEFCCSNWFGQQCKAQCDEGLERTQACDGAEDCGAGDVCCALPDGLVARSYSSTCKMACTAGEYEIESSLACEPSDGIADVGATPNTGAEANSGQVRDDDDGADPDADSDLPAEDNDENMALPEDNSGPAGPRPDQDDDCRLIARAEVRDEDGPCQQCRSGDYITVVGAVSNPCGVPLTYRSQLDCLVSEFIVLNLEFETRAEYPMTCRMGARIEEIAPGETIIQTRPAGRLSTNPYELSVQFENANRVLRTVRFTVE